MRSEQEIREMLQRAIDNTGWLLSEGRSEESIRELIGCLKWVLNEQDDKVH